MAAVLAIPTAVAEALEVAALVTSLIQQWKRGKLTDEEFEEAWGNMQVSLQDSIDLFELALAKAKEREGNIPTG